MSASEASFLLPPLLHGLLPSSFGVIVTVANDVVVGILFVVDVVQLDYVALKRRLNRPLNHPSNRNLHRRQAEAERTGHAEQSITSLRHPRRLESFRNVVPHLRIKSHQFASQIFTSAAAEEQNDAWPRDRAHNYELYGEAAAHLDIGHRETIRWKYTIATEIVFFATCSCPTRILPEDYYGSPGRVETTRFVTLDTSRRIQRRYIPTTITIATTAPTTTKKTATTGVLLRQARRAMLERLTAYILAPAAHRVSDSPEVVVDEGKGHRQLHRGSRGRSAQGAHEGRSIAPHQGCPGDAVEACRDNRGHNTEDNRHKQRG